MSPASGGQHGKNNDICPVCGIKWRVHPRCEACGILTGLGHETLAEEFREHKLCEGCKMSWLRMERKKKKSVEWRTFFTLGWGKEALNR